MPLRLDPSRHRATDDATRRHGRWQIPAHLRRPAGWTPLRPGIRQNLAPTHYADRALPAGPDDRTGLMPAITTEVTP